MKYTHYIVFSLVMMATILHAQNNIEFSGQIRQRFESVDKTFKAKMSASNFNALRSRFNARFAPTENVSGLFQLQDYRGFGSESSTMDGSGDAIDLHQANVTISKLFDQPIDLKIGRMEYNMGPQRLIGSVGWSNIGRSFDGIVLSYHQDGMAIKAFNFKEDERYNESDTDDQNIMGIEATLALSDGLKVNPFVIRQNTVDTFSRITAGADINGKLGDLGYEIEVAYQLGGTDDYDLAGKMVAINLSYTIENIGLSAGLDIMSGNNTETKDVNETFNTLYATNHKYYGLMDYFPEYSNEAGLIDLHVKATLKPMEKIALAAAAHSFLSAGVTTLDENTTGVAYMTELDFTGKYAYSEHIGFQGGLSIGLPGEIFKFVYGEELATWFYLMTTVDF